MTVLSVEEQKKAAIALDMDERAANIWAWVRENRNSLDSGRGCRMIKEMIDAAVESVCEQIAPLLLEIDELKEKLTDARAKAKADLAAHEVVVKSLSSCNTKLAKANREIAVLRDKAVVVN